jgi:LmbE family N-acetylglucosaminyl deacetylase
MSRRVQVIGAHSADFVWRAGGAVAKAVEAGGVVEVIATYYGQRAEQRGNRARRASGNQDVRDAEAFQRLIPQVVSEL